MGSICLLRSSADHICRQIVEDECAAIQMMLDVFLFELHLLPYLVCVETAVSLNYISC